MVTLASRAKCRKQICPRAVAHYMGVSRLDLHRATKAIGYCGLCGFHTLSSARGDCERAPNTFFKQASLGLKHCIHSWLLNSQASHESLGDGVKRWGTCDALGYLLCLVKSSEVQHY